MDEIREFLAQSATAHKNLCPRQVLGVRMGRCAARLLGFDPMQVEKRLLVIVETDGCFATGVSTATRCTIGSRNLRIEDLGKAAATFTDTKLGRSVRIAPSAESRALAEQYAPEVPDRWEAMLEGYQRIPDELLFSWQPVELLTSIEAIFSKPGVRTACQVCGEEIINEREVVRDGQVLCRSCAGFSYYTPAIAQAQPLADGQPARRVARPLHRVPAQGKNGSSRTPGDTGRGELG
ncbi:MAG: formylmethanofuran dehydrogenase [Anaerolineae bacterium]|nr:formylmethanofuran dehydrogenase [Anaerolineae bacterium]